MSRFLFVIALAAATTSRTTEKIETFPDGSKHLVYSVAKDGTKNGPYKEYFPGGKVSVQANYSDDQLDGAYHSYYSSGKVKLATGYRKGQLDGKNVEFTESGTILRSVSYKAGKQSGASLEYNKGQLIKAEFWAAGKLVVPKSPELIANEIAQINRAQIKWTGTVSLVSDDVAASLKDPLLNADRETALRALMAYRCITGVPYDLAMDRDETAHAQAGAELLSRVDKLSHTPDNPGLPDGDYKFAYRGTTSSNIHSRKPNGESLLGALKDWVGDSDDANIGALGHRRWCLNPSMQSTGFGIYGNYAAMWSLDMTRTDVPDFDFITFPPRGMAPVESFHNKDAWTVSLNPAKYRKPAKVDLKVLVWPARLMARQGALEKGSPQMSIEKFNLSFDNAGIPICIIFRPVGVSVVPDNAYWVEIDGVKTKSGEAAEIEFLVDFFALSQTRASRH